jgi:hypothetical protein
MRGAGRLRLITRVLRLIARANARWNGIARQRGELRKCRLCARLGGWAVNGRGARRRGNRLCRQATACSYGQGRGRECPSRARRGDAAPHAGGHDAGVVRLRGGLR